jgi:hypothetical protein
MEVWLLNNSAPPDKDVGRPHGRRAASRELEASLLDHLLNARW